MTENEKNFWLDGDNGLKPYLRMKDKGMPRGKIEQIAWLLLQGSLCGFCKVCRDNPCEIKDGEGCTGNIARYIRETVLNEVESELKQYRAIGTVEECRGNKKLLEFLYDTINPNDMESYTSVYNATDEKSE